MFLVFIGPGGTLRCSWTEFLLLRDNVQHHLEGRSRSTRYTALHTMADGCLTVNGVAVPAESLIDELTQASDLLSGIPITKLAISLRTDAMLSSGDVPPQDSGTMLMRLTPGHIVFPVFKARTIADAFRNVLDGLPRLATGPGFPVVRVSAPGPRMRARYASTPFDPRRRLS